MSEKRPCRKCLIQDLPRGAELRKIIEERLSQMPEEEKTGSETYAARLNECRSCGELREGTCGACGCYVELRAARRAKDCPLKKWRAAVFPEGSGQERT